MAHSPLACHVMEKSFQQAASVQHLFEILQGLNHGLDRVFEEAKKTEEKIAEVKKQVIEIAAFQTEQVKENI